MEDARYSDGFYKGMNFEDTTFYKEKYFTFPIELFIGFLDDSDRCMRDVLSYHCAGLNTSEREAFKQVYYLKGKDVKRGEELRAKTYSNVNFSITRRMFSFYWCIERDEVKKLALLAYLSLKSMKGSRRIGSRRIVASDAETMFVRMAGFPTKKVFEQSGGVKDVGKIGYYMENARRMRYWSEKLRMELMESYDEFHSYSCPQKRGFVYMFARGKRESFMKEMAVFMAERTAKYKIRKYKDMMREASIIANNGVKSGKKHNVTNTS